MWQLLVGCAAVVVCLVVAFATTSAGCEIIRSLVRRRRHHRFLRLRDEMIREREARERLVAADHQEAAAS